MFFHVISVLFLWQSVTCSQGGMPNMEYIKVYEGVSLNTTGTLESIAEDHKVTTEDDYILTLKRIKSKGPPVLIMHGLFGSSQDFIVFGNDKSLAYSLAEQGYDIWLGNNRGNTFSRSHKSFEVNSANFWNFSFHEMGYYDCPASIDYILSETNSTSLTIIGHAQGATQILVMAATRPEYSSKVNQIIAFAPFVYMHHIPHPIIQLIKSQYSLVEVLLLKYHIDEFLGHNPKIAGLLKLACKSPSISKYCSLVPYLLGGMNPEALDVDIPIQMFDVFPAGTSSKNIRHLLQQVNSGEFKQFDYGLVGNMNQYKQLKPPVYNLSAITIPVNIFYSKNDWLAGEADIEKLEMELPNCEKKVVPLKYFNHYDYVLANDVKSLLHYDVINLVNDNHNRSEITSTSTTTEVNTPTTKQQPSPPTIKTSTHSSTATTHSSTLTPNVTTTQKTNSGYILGYSLIVLVLCTVCLII